MSRDFGYVTVNGVNSNDINIFLNVPLIFTLPFFTNSAMIDSMEIL